MRDGEGRLLFNMGRVCIHDMTSMLLSYERLAIAYLRVCHPIKTADV